MWMVSAPWHLISIVFMSPPLSSYYPRYRAFASLENKHFSSSIRPIILALFCTPVYTVTRSREGKIKRRDKMTKLEKMLEAEKRPGVVKILRDLIRAERKDKEYTDGLAAIQNTMTLNGHSY